jgi:glycine oxidase
MDNGTEVVVIGAGIAGSAAAYYLAREGVKVQIVESEAVGCGASGYAVGLLNPLVGTGVPGALAPLAETAFRMHIDLWPVLEDEAGVDFQARMMPHLQLCFTEYEVRDQKLEMVRWADADGFRAEWLEPEQVHMLEPRVSEEVLGAVLLQDVGVLDSYRLTLAFLRAAEAHGAELVHGEATALDTLGGRVTGVSIGRRAIECDAVVIALGPWSGRVAEWLDVTIPVEPLKGQIIHLEGPAEPFRYHMAGPGQVAYKADGYVWLASTEEEAGFDVSLTRDARDTLMDRGLRMVPSLGDLKLVRQTACLRPVTPDRLPVLGGAPGWEGLYLATGAEKKGILLGPAMGRAVADLITGGSTDLPVGPFSPERFAG